jgi:hypothetical protein
VQPSTDLMHTNNHPSNRKKVAQHRLRRCSFASLTCACGTVQAGQAQPPSHPPGMLRTGCFPSGDDVAKPIRWAPISEPQ